MHLHMIVADAATFSVVVVAVVVADAVTVSTMLIFII
jgi:hypothetical protein